MIPSQLQFIPVLASITFLVIAANIFGRLFVKLGLPKVVGQILGGILLGNSFLGGLSPIFYGLIFNSFEGQDKILQSISWIGLALLMFASGVHLPKSIGRNTYLHVALLVIGGTAIPILFGGLISSVFYGGMQTSNFLVFAIIIGVAFSVTSIPVISSIFSQLNLTSTKFAANILIAAGVQDFILWSIVGLALNINEMGNSLEYIKPQSVALEILKLISIATFLFILPKKLFLNDHYLKYFKKNAVKNLFFTISACFLITGLLFILGINLIIAIMISGYIFSKYDIDPLKISKINLAKIGDNLFIPLYFGYCGFSINFMSAINIDLVIKFLIFSSIIKILSVLFCFTLAKRDLLQSLDYAIVFNARGGPGIALATIAFGSGIINENLFFAFIFASIVTSLFAGSWLKIRIASIK